MDTVTTITGVSLNEAEFKAINILTTTFVEIDRSCDFRYTLIKKGDFKLLTINDLHEGGNTYQWKISEAGIIESFQFKPRYAGKFKTPESFF